MSRKSCIYLFSILVLLGAFLVPELLAQEVTQQAVAAATADKPPAAPSSMQILMKMIPMFFIVFAIFYFMVLRPQEKKIRAQSDLLSNLKKGLTVVTEGGIIGKVAGETDGNVILEIANNVKIKVEASKIEKKYEKASK